MTRHCVHNCKVLKVLCQFRTSHTNSVERFLLEMLTVTHLDNKFSSPPPQSRIIQFSVHRKRHWILSWSSEIQSVPWSPIYSRFILECPSGIHLGIQTNKWSLPSTFSDKNCVCISYLSVRTISHRCFWIDSYIHKAEIRTQDELVIHVCAKKKKKINKFEIHAKLIFIMQFKQIHVGRDMFMQMKWAKQMSKEKMEL